MYSSTNIIDIYMRMEKILISVDPFPIKRAEDDFNFVSRHLFRLAELFLSAGKTVYFVCNMDYKDLIVENNVIDGVCKNVILLHPPKGIYIALFEKYNSDILAWKSLIDETSYSKDRNYQSFFMEIKNLYDPDVVICWSHNLCIKKVFNDRPLIFLELGMLREPYPVLCYWDTNGLNGSSSFSSLVNIWKEQLSPEMRAYLLDIFDEFKKYIDKVKDITLDPVTLIRFKEIEKPYIVFFLQSEVDANTLVFGNGHDLSTIMYLAKKLNEEGDVNALVKPHPGNKFYYKFFCEANGIDYIDNIRSVDLADNSIGAIAINSSTILESILAEKPVLQLGRSPLSDAGLSMMSSDIQGFFGQLAQSREGKSEIKKEDKIIIALFVFAYQFPFNFLHRVDYLAKRLEIEARYKDKQCIPFEELAEIVRLNISETMELLRSKYLQLKKEKELVELAHPVAVKKSFIKRLKTLFSR